MATTKTNEIIDQSGRIAIGHVVTTREGAHETDTRSAEGHAHPTQAASATPEDAVESATAIARGTHDGGDHETDTAPKTATGRAADAIATRSQTTMTSPVAQDTTH